jgi:hypothetical protein
MFGGPRHPGSAATKFVIGFEGGPVPRSCVVAILFSLALVGPTRVMAQDLAELTRQVLAAEGAFAESMKARDFDRFASHVAEDAIFFGDGGAQRGKQAILAAWRPGQCSLPTARA